MRLYLRLLGIQLNQRFGLSAIRAGLRDNRLRTLGRGALYLIVFLSIGVLVGMYTWLIDALMPTFTALGLETLLLGLVLFVAMLFVFFMGMVYLLGMLFFAKDTEFLASLPIPQRTVFAAKFSQVLLGEIGTGLVLLLPPFIVYGIHTGADALFWVRAVVVALTMPCIPLAISAVLSLLLMRFNALWRHRELLTVIGSVLLIVLVFVGQGLLTSAIPEVVTEEAILALISDSSRLLRQVVSAFPPSGWAAEGLAFGGGQLWLFLGASVVALAIVLLLAGRIYYGGAMAHLETASTQRRVSISGGNVRQRSPLAALFLREWRTVVRSPIYALNGLIVILVGPLMMILPKLMQGSTGDAEMDAVFALLDGAVDARMILLILAALFVGISMISPAVTTSISREGSNFYLLRTIPISPARQIMAKYLFGCSVALLTMLLMGVAGLLLYGFSGTIVAGAFALGMLASIAPLALSIIPDTIKPKLSWNSETEAIKQNFNAIWGMLIGWGYLALLVFGAIKAMGAGMDMGLLMGLAVAVSVVLGAASLLALCAAARRSWRVIEG